MKEGSTIDCSILLLGDMSKMNAGYRVVKCFTYVWNFCFHYFHSYLFLFSLLIFQTVNLTLTKGEKWQKKYDNITNKQTNNG